MGLKDETNKLNEKDANKVSGGAYSRTGTYDTNNKYGAYPDGQFILYRFGTGDWQYEISNLFQERDIVQFLSDKAQEKDFMGTVEYKLVYKEGSYSIERAVGDFYFDPDIGAY